MPPTPNEITLNMIRESLGAAVVADALDTLGLHDQSPRVPFQQYSGEGLLAGRCKTTLWADLYHEDPQPYALELQAVDACGPDDVLVAAAGGSLRSALWGELLTTASRNRGCQGAIVDGAVRDLQRIRRMHFPVFARGTSVYDSRNRQRVTDVDVPVEIGGVRLCPGDLVLADADGIVVVPRRWERETLRRAWEKVHAENVTREAIRDGLKATEAYAKYGVL